MRRAFLARRWRKPPRGMKRTRRKVSEKLEGAWAEKNNCERLVRLRKLRRWYASHSVSGRATQRERFP
jgi:hypothetical protein